MEAVKVSAISRSQWTKTGVLAAQENVSFQTIQRACTGLGYSGEEHSNAFDAVEDFKNRGWADIFDG